jgi:hypothetical protein
MLNDALFAVWLAAHLHRPKYEQDYQEGDYSYCQQIAQ